MEHVMDREEALAQMRLLRNGRKAAAAELEPLAVGVMHPNGEAIVELAQAAAISQAISLRRIADALEARNPKPRPIPTADDFQAAVDFFKALGRAGER